MYKKGDRVVHWFAGPGTVHSVTGKRGASVRVRWDRTGKLEGAYASDCKPENANRRAARATDSRGDDNG